MPYRHSAVRIHEIIQADKVLGSGQSVHGQKKGKQGLAFEATVDLLDGGFLDMIFRGKAGVNSIPTTYDGNFFLEQQRVRGVGYCAVSRQSFRAKQRIPSGWHQNIIDPNLPTTDPGYNRHEPLPDFQPTDFAAFTRELATMWAIDLDWEGDLL